MILRHAQDQLTEEIAPGHDLVRFGGVGQVERPPHHAMQTAVVRHVHHRGEAAPTAGAAAHQRQWTALQNGQIERDLAPRRRPGDDQPATGLEARETLIPHGCADTVEHHIDAAARLHLVSADLVRAVVAVESEFDALAVSSKGAQGLMQLMPHTARRFGVGDSFDARQNVFGGVHYLRYLLDLFSGNVELALAAYNAGENAVHRYHGVPPYRETRQYVQKVQAILGSGFEQVRAAFFAPTRAPAPKLAKPVKVQPARPRIYYKWRDERGLHVAETPPVEGTVYTMIRALD